MFTFGKHVVTYETRLELGTWYLTYFSLEDAMVGLLKNGEPEFSETVSIPNLTDRVYNRSLADIWIGAVRGSYDFFHGHMGHFWMYYQVTFDELQENLFGELIDELLDTGSMGGAKLGHCPYGYSFFD